MLGGQLLEGPPVHPLRLRTIAVEKPWLPAQLRAYSVGAACDSFIPSFALAGISEAIALAASENRAAIENRHTPSAAPYGASEPRTLTAKIAESPIEPYGVVFILPLATPAQMAINQNHTGRRHPTG